MAVDVNDVNVKVGLMIKKYRMSKGLTQEELSFEAGLHRTYIGHVERAEKNITIKNVEKIAKGLNIDISELFDFSKLKEEDFK